MTIKLVNDSIETTTGPEELTSPLFLIFNKSSLSMPAWNSFERENSSKIKSLPATKAKTLLGSN